MTSLYKYLKSKLVISATDNILCNETPLDLTLLLQPELLCQIFLMLDVGDLASVEEVCKRFRNVVILNKIYKKKLDRIFHTKKVNNYMSLSEEAERSR